MFSFTCWPFTARLTRRRRYAFELADYQPIIVAMQVMVSADSVIVNSFEAFAV